MDLPDVCVRHVRDMVEDIAKRKEFESENVRCLEKYMIYNTAILSFSRQTIQSNHSRDLQTFVSVTCETWWRI